MLRSTLSNIPQESLGNLKWKTMGTQIAQLTSECLDALPNTALELEPSTHWVLKTYTYRMEVGRQNG